MKVVKNLNYVPRNSLFTTLDLECIHGLAHTRPLIRRSLQNRMPQIATRLFADYHQSGRLLAILSYWKSC